MNSSHLPLPNIARIPKIGRSCVNHQKIVAQHMTPHDESSIDLETIRSWFCCLNDLNAHSCWFHPNSCFGSGHVTRHQRVTLKTHHVVTPDRSLWHGRNQSPAPRWFTKRGDWKSPNQMGGGTSSIARFEYRRVQEGTPKLCLLVYNPIYPLVN